MKPHPLLSQVPLIISPNIRPPQPVTLPLSYRAVFSEMPHQVDGDEIIEALSKLEEKLKELEENHSKVVKCYEEWKNDVNAQTKAELRRIAPGYLDSEAKLLVPQRPAVSGSSDNHPTDLTKTFERIHINDEIKLEQLK